MKVLIIRSCHLMQFNYICQRLKEKYLKLNLTAIVQKDVAAVIKAQGFADKLILTETGEPFSAKRLSAASIENMQKEKYDLFVIPYNNHSGVRYLAVEKIALLSRALKVITVMTDGKAYEYTHFFWKFKFMQKHIVALLDRLIFIILSLGLLISAAVFKLLFLFIPQSKRRRITFITPQNYNYPSARVRVYDFAEIFKKHDFVCKIISYDDLLIIRSDKDPIPEEMSDSRKLLVNVLVFFKLLLLDNSSFFYIQKVKYNALAPYLVSLIKNVKLIIDLDDNEFLSPVFNFFKSEQFLKIMAKKSFIAVVASKKLEQLMSIYTSALFYVPTVVDPQKFYLLDKAERSFSASEKVVFGWAGIVFGPPVLENVQYIFQCFKLVNELLENVVLRLAIAGPLLDLVYNDLKDNYQGCNIEIVDWLPITKMNDFYNSLDVGLNPLIRDDLFTQCKSPTKLFEYMACGLPSITHNLGEATYIIEDGKDGFLVNNQVDFVDRMKVLSVNKLLRIQMGKSARAKIEKSYSLTAIEDTLLQVITSTN